jgi:hypothetical protein
MIELLNAEEAVAQNRLIAFQFSPVVAQCLHD